MILLPYWDRHFPGFQTGWMMVRPDAVQAVIADRHITEWRKGDAWIDYWVAGVNYRIQMPLVQFMELLRGDWSEWQ